MLTRAAVYERDGTVSLQEYELGELNPGEIIVRVMASGICKSDVLEYYRKPAAPIVLGHEVSGVVIEVRDADHGLTAGDRVFCMQRVPCGQCILCQSNLATSCKLFGTSRFNPGGYSEYIRLDSFHAANGVLQLPETLTFDAATFIEPLGCCLRSLTRTNLRREGAFLIIGCGINGLLQIQLARHNGASRIVVIERRRARRELAFASGADQVMDESALEDPLLPGGKVDVVLLNAVDEKTFSKSFESLKAGGHLIVFGWSSPSLKCHFPAGRIMKEELTVSGSYSAGPEELREALNLLSSGSVRTNTFISVRIGLERIAEGFELTRSGGEVVKVVVNPHPESAA